MYSKGFEEATVPVSFLFEVDVADVGAVELADCLAVSVDRRLEVVSRSA